MTGQTVMLTRDLIEKCRTEKGAFTGATVRAFGLNWNSLKSGWPRRLEGKVITQEEYMNALLGRQLAKKKNRDRTHPGLFDVPESEEQRTPMFIL